MRYGGEILLMLLGHVHDTLDTGLRHEDNADYGQPTANSYGQRRRNKIQTAIL